jgi:hypothetical protein
MALLLRCFSLCAKASLEDSRDANDNDDVPEAKTKTSTPAPASVRNAHSMHYVPDDASHGEVEQQVRGARRARMSHGNCPPIVCLQAQVFFCATGAAGNTRAAW